MQNSIIEAEKEEKREDEEKQNRGEVEEKVEENNIEARKEEKRKEEEKQKMRAVEEHVNNMQNIIIEEDQQLLLLQQKREADRLTERDDFEQGRREELATTMRRKFQLEPKDQVHNFLCILIHKIECLFLGCL